MGIWTGSSIKNNEPWQKKMKDRSAIKKRGVTGIILVLLIILSICKGQNTFIFLLLIINLLAVLEFYQLFFRAGVMPRVAMGSILSTCILMTVAFVVTGVAVSTIYLINIPLVFSIFISELYRKAKNPFDDLAFTFLGIFMVTIPLCLFATIAFLPVHSGKYHAQIVLGYFFILWASDTAAYLIGGAFGKHALFLRVSPAKTWEGSLAGAAGAFLVAYFVSRHFTGLSTTGWAAIASIIVIMGGYGDLIKSLIKRSLNVKDSGTILPGHGGMLDRFDTLLGSAPFVFSYLILFPYA